MNCVKTQSFEFTLRKIRKPVRDWKRSHPASCFAWRSPYFCSAASIALAMFLYRVIRPTSGLLSLDEDTSSELSKPPHSCDNSMRTLGGPREEELSSDSEISPNGMLASISKVVSE
eukprot:CAMPEP_0115339532 /NCGR_PEP_ID=MMETSP0270-20121206/90664_1 /TAXON_ID=71861 /ORGANISM="Scrippsiella trochoidea, Strain CCMP3099" /LENGTH=115 /DNA_ID=CAMNT_0002760927 /DNA_START=103 /DNA_END=450 /DNA_ORIENTATION=-